MVKLDILSDPICPWCYIGKAQSRPRPDARCPTIRSTIEWHPFQLNPEMPAEGMDRRAYLERQVRRQGGGDGGLPADPRAMPKSAGLDIAFDRITRTPNTLDAHRLIHWAGIEGRQTAAVSALFKAYFTRGATSATARRWPTSPTGSGWTPA